MSFGESSSTGIVIGFMSALGAGSAGGSSGSSSSCASSIGKGSISPGALIGAMSPWNCMSGALGGGGRGSSVSFFFFRKSNIPIFAPFLSSGCMS